MNDLFVSSNVLKGGIAQAKAEMRALEKGYLVSKPITEGSRYDMIIDDGNKLLRIQVKYAGGNLSKPNGASRVDFRKNSNSGKVKIGYTKEEVDAIVVYVPEVDEVCYFPIELVEGKGVLYIRYEKAKNNQLKNTIMVNDYIW